MSKNLKLAEELIDFAHQSPTPFHVVQNAAQMLLDGGYEELHLNESWNIKVGGHYFVRCFGTSLIAFEVNKSLVTSGWNIVAAHTDSPMIRIKPNPVRSVEGKYAKLNTEIYGGPVLHTWIDRPLSIAGRVMIKTADTFRPEARLIDFRRPLGVIPGVAIHFDRQINDQMSINKQNDMQVLISAVQDSLPTEETLREMIADELGVETEDILDFDLYVYDCERGQIVGFDQSMILSPRMDDLCMVYPPLKIMTGLVKESKWQKRMGHIFGNDNEEAEKDADAAIDWESFTSSDSPMLVLFDNEEVGSGTKQGAASPILRDVIERIGICLGHSEEQRLRTIYNSFVVSADVAHALHPNHPEHHDPVLHPVLNGGTVIKINANQKYMTDADGSAVFISVCNDMNVKCQMVANRSDMAGGSTLGNILTSQMSVRGVDVGLPLLSMHSARETVGVDDLDGFYFACERVLGCTISRSSPMRFDHGTEL